MAVSTDEVTVRIKAYLPLVLFLVAQTGAGIWWASRNNARQEFLIEQIRELKQVAKEASADRYTSADAMRDWSAFETWRNGIERRVERLEAQRDGR